MEAETKLTRYEIYGGIEEYGNIVGYIVGDSQEKHHLITSQKMRELALKGEIETQYAEEDLAIREIHNGGVRLKKQRVDLIERGYLAAANISLNAVDHIKSTFLYVYGNPNELLKFLKWMHKVTGTDRILMYCVNRV